MLQLFLKWICNYRLKNIFQNTNLCLSSVQNNDNTLGCMSWLHPKITDIWPEGPYHYHRLISLFSLPTAKSCQYMRRAVLNEIYYIEEGEGYYRLQTLQKNICVNVVWCLSFFEACPVEGCFTWTFNVWGKPDASMPDNAYLLLCMCKCGFIFLFAWRKIERHHLILNRLCYGVFGGREKKAHWLPRNGVSHCLPLIYSVSSFSCSASSQRGNSRPIRFEPPMLDFHEQ